MKFCKVTIEKDRSGGATQFVYPTNYDPRDHDVLGYENQGAAVETAITMVPDDFDFSGEGFEELTAAQAEAAIDAFVDTDKDLQKFDASRFASLDEAKAHHKEVRKARGRERKKVRETVAARREGRPAPVVRRKPRG